MRRWNDSTVMHLLILRSGFILQIVKAETFLVLLEEIWEAVLCSCIAQLHFFIKYRRRNQKMCFY